MSDYRDVNRANWDERVPAHVASPSYHVEQFLADPSYLSGVVRFDVPRLGAISGLRGVHLQCHIGTDTVSLARLGARMSGLDFSAPAVEHGQSLADRLGLSMDFHVADVYDAVDVLGSATYDFVYTGIGALCWLPDIQRWAHVVAGLLKPGGRLFVREGHPMLWSLDAGAQHPEVRYPYFETAEAIVVDEGGTYVETEVDFDSTVTHEWNHGLAEIITALQQAGLVFDSLTEHDSAPWNALPGLMTEDGAGEWRLTENPDRLAATYTLRAHKPS
ncbi:class I SAM-dependent methyltransferase [Kribbella solani]|uniref:class I SAM-dependent methyltransferase n=1 Tax=Kribbella solani TaxID=236067 RepID=UPI0029B177A2|nr:class I SAM-dependent methyltransferase [Kribbella solani]MDX2969302.1 class I SAM-dependent methyltransferase [Kribbella solani]MDX3001433.1 class I SAM-dependent methyltransferase [Kribbella solani]